MAKTSWIHSLSPRLGTHMHLSIKILEKPATTTSLHPTALFGTRVLVEISGDNPLEYWVKPPPSPNPHKTPPTIH
jgi:hypothetical protein